MRLSQQIIIKFKSDTIACDATEIAHLSAVTHVPLRHVRPMSRDACVIQQLRMTPTAFSRDKTAQTPSCDRMAGGRSDDGDPFVSMGWGRSAASQ